HQGGLARAVGAQQTEHAGAYLQGYAVERPHAFRVRLRERLDAHLHKRPPTFCRATGTPLISDRARSTASWSWLGTVLYVWAKRRIASSRPTLSAQSASATTIRTWESWRYKLHGNPRRRRSRVSWLLPCNRLRTARSACL